MPEAQVFPAILAVGAASYAMRAGGYLAAAALPTGGHLPRLLRVFPGNLIAAFAAAGILEGGWPSLAGSVAAIAAMTVTGREWVALVAGFGAAALAVTVF